MIFLQLGQCGLGVGGFGLQVLDEGLGCAKLALSIDPHIPESLVIIRTPKKARLLSDVPVYLTVREVSRILLSAC